MRFQGSSMCLTDAKCLAVVRDVMLIRPDAEGLGLSARVGSCFVYIPVISYTLYIGQHNGVCLSRLSAQLLHEICSM